MKKIIILAALSFWGINAIYSQNTGFGIIEPDANAIIDAFATDKGILIPRVDITDVATEAPLTAPVAESTLVYNTNAITGEGFYYWDGAKWERIVSANELTTEPWFGTDDNAGATENTEDIYQMARVGIGTETPVAMLEIADDETTYPTILGNSRGHAISVQTERGFSIVATRASSSIGAADIIQRKARGTLENPLAVERNDGLFKIGGRGHDGTDYGKAVANIRFVAAEDFTPTSKPTAMLFGTTNLGEVYQDLNMLLNYDGKLLLKQDLGEDLIELPTNQLHVVDAADPLRLEGLQAGAATDEILTVDATGVVKKQAAGAVAAATEPWFGTDDNAGATENIEDIYQMGRVGIGLTNPSSILQVEGNGDALPLILVRNNVGKDAAVMSFGGEPSGDWASVGMLNGGLSLSGNYNAATSPHMYVDEVGNVGINILTPTHKLHVSEENPLRLEGLQAGVAPLTDEILLTDATGVVKKGGTLAAAVAEPWFGTDDNAGATENTEDIYQMAKVGIGTETPDAMLEIRSEIPPAIPGDTKGIGISLSIDRGFGIVATRFSDSDGAADMVQRKARGTIDAPMPVEFADVLANFAARGYGNNSFGGAPTTSIQFKAAQDFSAGNRGSAMLFATSEIGGTYYRTNMLLNSDGKLLLKKHLDKDLSELPTNQLHVVDTTDPLRLEGLQAGAAPLTDEILLTDATGVVKKGGTLADLNDDDWIINANLTGLEAAPAATVDVGFGLYPNTASGVYSIAMGAHTTASGQASTSMGWDTKAEAQLSVAIGKWNVGGGTADDWILTDPLFEIGNGASGALSNALTVLKSGNTGIGTDTPKTSLHVYDKDNPATEVENIVTIGKEYDLVALGLESANSATFNARESSYLRTNSFQDRTDIDFTSRAYAAMGGGSLIINTIQGGTQGNAGTGLRTRVSNGSLPFSDNTGDLLKYDDWLPHMATADNYKGSFTLRNRTGGRYVNLVSLQPNGDIRFNASSTTNVAPNDGTNRMIIKADGNVGIGTIAPTAKLSVNGTANKTGGGSWAVFSDARSKENINTYTRGLDELMQIRPVSFNYKKEFDFGSKTHVGLIAQEVEKVVPTMVSEIEVKDIKDFKEVDPNELTYMLINAVKELKLKVEVLEAQNTALKAELSETTELKVRIAEIEKALGIKEDISTK